LGHKVYLIDVPQDLRLSGGHTGVKEFSDVTQSRFNKLTNITKQLGLNRAWANLQKAVRDGS